jgi:ABC-type nitrate/sulfonate/bicarbonate transport system substrate-binding protein
MFDLVIERLENKGNETMKMRYRWNWLVASLACVCLSGIGCNNSKSGNGASTGGNSTAATGNTGGSSSAKPQTFTLAWSEYPSWSIFGVADEVGLINGKAGELGSIEKKHNVDIVLQLAGYDACITLYGNSKADAVCITNIDILGASSSRNSVAILPTSTSAGADACIVGGIGSIEELAGKTTRGLEKSVSQYAFERCLEKLGKNPADYPFSNMDPEQAAQAFQGKDANVTSIMVWNPFVMQSLRSRTDAKVLFSSDSIQEEIIDMVVVGKDALDRPGGKAFADAVLETFYAMNKRMTDPTTSDSTLVGIGARFAKLELDDMKTIVQQTKFYGDPNEAKRLFASEKFQKETMPVVSTFCVKYGLTPTPVELSFGDAKGVMEFDTKYLDAYIASQASGAAGK